MPASRVLVVDERRVLASVLASVLDGWPGIQQASVLQDLSALPAAISSGWDVIVTSEGYAHHVLRIAPPVTRVLVVMQRADVPSLSLLLRFGAAGACTFADLPADVAAAVTQVAAGEMRLPGFLVQEVLEELRRLQRRAQEAEDVLSLLTERERDVLTGLGQGRGRTEIARDLGLSPHTVRTHAQHLLRKLSLHSQLEAGAFARDLLSALAPSPRLSRGDDVVIDFEQHKDRRTTFHDC